MVTNDSDKGIQFSSDKEGSRMKVVKYIYSEIKDGTDEFKGNNININSNSNKDNLNNIVYPNVNK